jgi:hypothetical protein
LSNVEFKGKITDSNTRKAAEAEEKEKAGEPKGT